MGRRLNVLHLASFLVLHALTISLCVRPGTRISPYTLNEKKLKTAATTREVWWIVFVTVGLLGRVSLKVVCQSNYTEMFSIIQNTTLTRCTSSDNSLSRPFSAPRPSASQTPQDTTCSVPLYRFSHYPSSSQSPHPFRCCSTDRESRSCPYPRY